MAERRLEFDIRHAKIKFKYDLEIEAMRARQTRKLKEMELTHYANMQKLYLEYGVTLLKGIADIVQTLISKKSE